MVEEGDVLEEEDEDAALLLLLPWWLSCSEGHMTKALKHGRRRRAMGEEKLKSLCSLSVCPADVK